MISNMTPYARAVMAERLTAELAQPLPEPPRTLPRGFIRLGEQITWTNLGRDSK